MDGRQEHRDGCDRWAAVAPTDSLDGVGGVIDRYERYVPPAAGISAELMFARLVERLMHYEIFPKSIMQSVVCSDDGLVHEGTTIVQRVTIGRLRIESAVRVLRVWRTDDIGTEEAGFTYATLPGHPERGISSFCVTRAKDTGRIAFVIEARSRPGSVLYRLGRPLARRFQRRATLAALDEFATG